MFYEREGQAIITSAIDINCDAATFYEVDGMITDDEYTYGESFMRGVEERWDDKIISDIIDGFRCKLHDKQIVRMIVGDDIDEAIMAMIQAITAVETYLYLIPKKTED